MKMNLKYLCVLPAALCLLVLSSCDSMLDDDFEAMNVNPTQADQINPNFKLTNIELRISGERYENWRTNLIYSSTMIQHFATLPTYWAGDKYLYIGSYSQAMWDRYYPNIARNIEDLRAQVCGEGEDATPNRCAITRILRVVMYHRLTDLHGDIPYSEAGKGFLEGITQPRYDPQSEIYADMLNELQEAAQMLTPGQPSFGSGDLIFEGDPVKWRKFAYSMMLRLGMRLVKVDPGMAQEWVQRAIAGGVMESNADIAAVPHDPAGWRNGNGEVFLADGNGHMSAFFVNWLQERNDPRLFVYGQVPVAGEEAVGLPNGYDAQTIQDHPTWVPCPPGSETDASVACEMRVYMDINPAIQGVDDPMFFQTYAEVELLLAEAAVRGWHSGDPATHYENGVRAAMEYLALYGADAIIPSSEVEAYLNENPYDPSRALEQINEQYWASVLLNEYEAYANWRRTGYPELTPVNYPGNVTGGTIPRRLRYAQGEAVANPVNYQEAVSRQGPDVLTTRIWWDVPQ